jgi:hypothetical protein
VDVNLKQIFMKVKHLDLQEFKSVIKRHLIDENQYTSNPPKKGEKTVPVK